MNKDSEKRFSMLNTIVSSGNEDELKFFIENNQDLLKVDPLLFISQHIMFYALKEQPSNVLSVIDHYKNAPYISMEVEDFLNELKEKFVKEYDKKDKKFNVENVKPYLLSKNEAKMLRALSYLSNVNIRNFLPLVKEFLLLEDIAYKYKTLALFILVEQKVDEVISVYKEGEILKINPINLKLPFDNDFYIEAKDYFSKTCEPSLFDTALEALNTVHIRTFPDTILEEYNPHLIVDVCIDVVRKMILGNTLGEEIKAKYHIGDDEFLDILEKINAILIS